MYVTSLTDQHKVHYISVNKESMEFVNICLSLNFTTEIFNILQKLMKQSKS